MHWLWVLIVGAIIGAIAGAITSKGQSMGWLSNIIAGLIGSSLGEALGTPACWDGHNSVNCWRDYIGSTCFIYYVPLKHG